MLGLGPALVLRVWWAPVIYILVFMLDDERIIFAEEMFLRRKFGQQYLDWASHTPAFIPRVAQWRPPVQRFRYGQVLRREHQTLLGIVMVFFVIETAGEWRLGQPVLGDTMWDLIAGAALAFFLVIRLLRKFTTVLRDKESNLPSPVPHDPASSLADP